MTKFIPRDGVRDNGVVLAAGLSVLDDNDDDSVGDGSREDGGVTDDDVLDCPLKKDLDVFDDDNIL